VESAHSIHVKNVKAIVAILKLNPLSIASDLWVVITNVTNLIVISLKLKRKMEVCSFIFLYVDFKTFNLYINIRNWMLLKDQVGFQFSCDRVSDLKEKKVCVSAHGFYYLTRISGDLAVLVRISRD